MKDIMGLSQSIVAGRRAKLFDFLVNGWLMVYSFKF